MTDLSIIAKHPDLPVIVFVDNYELADDYDTTAQGIYKADLAWIVEWDGRVYDNAESFIEDYCSICWREEPDEKKLEVKACELWKEHAKECIICYSHAAMMPKGCEIE